MATLGREQAGRQERHHAFILKEWETLAARAWDGYQRVGRGALHVEDDNIRRLERIDEVGVPVVLSIGYSLLDSLQGPTPEVAQLAQVYDPEHEIIVVVGYGDEPAVGYRVRGTPDMPTPPQCWQKLRGKLSPPANN